MARLNYSVSADVLRRVTYKSTKLFAIVDEFINSNCEVAEFVWADNEYSSARSACNSLMGSIKKRRITTVKATARGDKVYLVRLKEESDG